MISLMGDAPWPTLREDIQLRAFEPASNGAPQWTLFDPLARQYIRIGPLEHAALSRWHLGSAEKIAEAVRSSSSLMPTPEDVEDIRDFLNQHNLVRTDGRSLAAKLTNNAAAGQQPLPVKALKTYLFVKIPLWRPQAFLDAAWPFVRHLYQPTVAWFIAAITLFGLYQIGQDWEGYTTSFSYLFSASGVAAMALALVGIKVLHELGHAFTSKRYGVPVTRIGVALLVFWPVLYTDTTDAWRLSGKRQRLHILLAGLIVELAIAGLATAAWAITPDGPLRTALFFLSSASWITSVFVNLNPFMRFDGYYVLSDAAGVQNLQERAFALARWRMREALFQIGDRPPEVFEPARQFWLLCYAYGTWIYRVFLFLGIALVLTQLIAPVIGYSLAAIEIGAFLLLPIGKELKCWWQRRADIWSEPRTVVTTVCLACVIVLFFIPFSIPDHHPAVYRSFTSHPIYAPVDARLTTLGVTDGQQVTVGQVIAKLSSPQLDRDHRGALQDIAEFTSALRQRELGAASAKNTGQDTLLAVLRKLDAAREKRRAIEVIRDKLMIVAKVTGDIEMLDQTLKPGDWIGKGAPLFIIKDPSAPTVLAYVPADQAIERGERSHFAANLLSVPIMEVSGSQNSQDIGRDLQERALASPHGGPIAATPSPNGGMKTEMGLTEWRLNLAEHTSRDSRNDHILGKLRSQGARTSLAERIKQQLFQLAARF